MNVSQPASSASGMVKVTVTSGTRRVDLVLPSAVPVAELVPELARSVGLLDSATVYGGYRLVTGTGRRLENDAGLAIQGVEDGGVLTVSAGISEPAPRVYDDVVEAMADAVEHDLPGWDPASGRRTGLVAASLFLGLGALSLLSQGEHLLAGVTAAVIAALLCVGGVVLARSQDEPEAAVAVSSLAAFYAATAGFSLAPGTLARWSWPLPDTMFGLPLLVAGAAVVAVGAVAVVGLREGRPLMIPVLVIGTLMMLAAVAREVFDFSAAPTITVLLTVLVLAGSIFPWLALGATSTKVDQLLSHDDIVQDRPPVDSAAVEADARVAHEILLAVATTVGALLVLTAPFAVSLGVWGALLMVAASAAVMLRTRQYRTGSEVLVGQGSGVAGLIATTASALMLQPHWRSWIAVVLAVVGALLLAAVLTPATQSVRRGRAADVLESAVLLALPALLVLAIGVISAIGR